ncbi:MAG TPA: tyrosine-type recombinase/integrase [Solirubrobacterales bacterium]|nr:tyrosine-type recombinase/integrase [Solirubrobacterales bacterium]
MLLERTRVRVDAGVRAPRTLEMQEAHAELLLEHLGPRTRLERLTAHRIAGALERISRGRRLRADGSVRPISGNSLRKVASTLSQALKLAGREPALPEIPFRYQPRTDYLDGREYERIRDALPPHRRVWFVVAVWTGQRHSDVERMTREDLDPEAGWVNIRSTKTKRGPRRFHAAPELCRELLEHWRALPAGAPLVARWRHAASQLTYLSVVKLGMRRVTPHRLRHTFFTWYVAANGFTAELLELGGWSDMTIPSRVYAHAAPKRLQEQIERTHRLAMGSRRAPRKTRALITRGENRIGPAGSSLPAGPQPAQVEKTPGQEQIVASPAPPGKPVGAEGIEPSTNGLRAINPRTCVDLLRARLVGSPGFPRRDHDAEGDEETIARA